jgi:hypothetical protein
VGPYLAFVVDSGRHGQCLYVSDRCNQFHGYSWLDDWPYFARHLGTRGYLESSLMLRRWYWWLRVLWAERTEQFVTVKAEWITKDEWP